MKIFLALVSLVAIFISLWVDFRWRQWMMTRKKERNESDHRTVK